MDTQKPQNLAIIGGGLAGLSLSLALHVHGISSTIYEVRGSSETTTGALLLSPNALHVLNKLGVYERIKNQGYLFETMEYKDENLETVDEYNFGNEQLFGFKCLRVYREVLLRELRAIVSERGIAVQYNKKFSHVVKEEKDSVSFAFSDGSIETASILVGADGIHSKVRKYIHPTIQPAYSGILAITSEVDVSKLRLPYPEFYLASSIVSKYGPFAFLPQNKQETEILVGRTNRYPEQNQAGWARLREDKEELKSMLIANQTEWPDLVQSAMENIEMDKMAIWPFYVVPPMSSWYSAKHRVLILGDAAHAIPPTTGQGASQAFEDILSLSLLLPKLSSKITLAGALSFWESYRRERIAKVMALTNKLNQKRLPAAEREKLGGDIVFKDLGGAEQQRWLFEPKIEETLKEWVKESS